MHPLRLAHQPDKDVQGVTVTVRSLFHPYSASAAAWSPAHATR